MEIDQDDLIFMLGELYVHKRLALTEIAELTKRCEQFEELQERIIQLEAELKGGT